MVIIFFPGGEEHHHRHHHRLLRDQQRSCRHLGGPLSQTSPHQQLFLGTDKYYFSKYEMTLNLRLTHKLGESCLCRPLCSAFCHDFQGVSHLLDLSFPSSNDISNNNDNIDDHNLSLYKQVQPNSFDLPLINISSKATVEISGRWNFSFFM